MSIYSKKFGVLTSDIMNYDRILENLSEDGPWQIFAIFLLIFPTMAGGIFVLTYTFTGKFIIERIQQPSMSIMFFLRKSSFF